MSKFTPSPSEVALVNQVFTIADTQKLGVVTGEAAVKVFSGSKLPPTVLAEIWAIADEDNNGVLTRKGVAIALRLLGHAQRGERVTAELVHKPGPLPTIEGLAPVPTQSAIGIPPAKSPPPTPPLTPQDKAKFLKLFLGCNPTNGLLPGEKARDVFVKSKLPVDKLSQIWALADTKNRGALDATDFTIAMYLIQGSMSGQLAAIPPSLPPSLYEQARNGVVPQATGDSGSFSPSMSGGFPGRGASAIQPHYTGQTLSSIQPQTTGQAMSSIRPQTTGQSRAGAPPLPSRTTPTFPFHPAAPQWDVTPAAKANSDSLFDSLDVQKKGYIEGEVAVPFMLQSNLPEEALAQVWDLADMNNDGRLTRDGFAVAMHLIQGKLGGKDIPTTLPPTLIPPSMRGGAATGAPAAPQIPDAMRDLLWDDSPPASATAPSYPQPVLQPQSTGMSARPPPARSPPPAHPPAPAAQDPFGNSFGNSFSGFSAAPTSHADLLGDDDEPAAASPPLQDRSAEVGNLKNQVTSTNKSLEVVRSEREAVERQLQEQASLLSGLQTQLSSAKAAFDTETRLLAQLKERHATQSAEIHKAREELIRAESDLSAVKMERSDIGGTLLREKDEVRELQRRMTETGMQIETTKAELEKARKEAKQQKGLLAIAKKQLATREAERSKVEAELGEANQELAQATKEREEADAELEKLEKEPAAAATPLTNGHATPTPSNDPTLAFAAAMPLPTSPEVSPPASILSKSTNPFDALVRSGSPRPDSPFLPFTASSTLPTPVAAPAPAQTDAGAKSEDPFGFSDAFGAQAEEIRTSTPDNSKAPFPPPIRIGSPLAPSENYASPTSDIDMFSTPPTTAAKPPSGGDEPRFPSLDGAFALDTPSTAVPATARPAASHDDTDLNHQLKDLEVDESDSDSDSDDEDDKPLAVVKDQLTSSESQANGTAGTSELSAFDDSFGISSPTDAKPPSPSRSDAATPVPNPTSATAPSDAFDAAFAPASTKEPPPAASIPAVVDSPKANGVAATAGVSDFDQALANISAADTSGAPSQFSFDTAFEDNFDFAAATAAQPTVAAVPASSSSAFPPPPTAATLQGTGSAFDDVFLSQSSSTLPGAVPGITMPVPSLSPAIPPVASPSTVLPTIPTVSFDDAFGASASADPVPALSASTSTQSNGKSPTGISFDDAFGSGNDSLTLDSSFTSRTSAESSASQPRYQPPAGAPPKAAFPSASPASSPRGSTSTVPRSSSPQARAVSPSPRGAPPPRPISRPGTADSDKGKPAPRHNRLSIRLPFGRKKKAHDVPPVPSLAQQQLVEEPTPAVEDDIEAVKTLCGMGFSRSQAVAALEDNAYDVQRALNSLLGQ